MAPVAIILGGIGGTFSALFGWLFFGLSLWAAVQVYFLVALMVSGGLIALALTRSRAQADVAKVNRIQNA
jgi:hypothetical protein